MYIENHGITQTLVHNGEKTYSNEIEWDADYDGEIANLSVDIHDNHTPFLFENAHSGEFSSAKSNGSMRIENAQRCKNQHYNVQMDNSQLAELFNLPVIKDSLDKRLRRDFLSKKMYCRPKIVQLYPYTPLKNSNGTPFEFSTKLPVTIVTDDPKERPITNLQGYKPVDSILLHKKHMNHTRKKKHVRFVKQEKEEKEEKEKEENIEHVPQKYTHISSPLPEEEIVLENVLPKTKHEKKPKTHVTFKARKKPKTYTRFSQKRKKTQRRTF